MSIDHTHKNIKQFTENVEILATLRYCMRKTKTIEAKKIEKISEIENPKSGPFPTKIGAQIDHSSKNIKKKLRNMPTFLQH